MRRVAVAAAILSAVALTARAQSTTVRGRVVADDTGDPLPNARVSLTTSAPQGAPVVLADAEGRFALTPPAGRYKIVASKSGYAQGDVTPTAGQAIEIRLRRGVAISGRVVDEFGDPVPYARIVAEVPATASRKPPATAGSTDSDDLGEYRLAGLPAGTFVVSAVTIGAQMVPINISPNQVMYGPQTHKTYYPDAATPDDAQAFRLQSGEDRLGIDFVVPAERPSPPPIIQTRAALGLDAPQAPDPRAAGVIRGRVVSTDGRAVGHAQVRLIPASRTVLVPFLTMLAEDDGRFEFQELPAGKFQVVATKTGYSPVPTTEPVAGPPILGLGRSVDLAEGETRERADISMARWGSLTGRVFDELNEPLQGAQVQVLQVRYEAGRRRLVPAGMSGRVSDDLGRYRLFNLAPGQYIISAAVGSVSSADLPGYTRSYFPGTPNPSEAQFVSMGQSQDVTGIDFAMSRTRTARVTGKLIDAAGGAGGGALNLLSSARSTSVTSVAVGARISSDGSFEFPNVPPGQYVIKADRGRKNGWTEGEFGTLPVSVNGEDVKDLILQTSTGSSITGRVTFDTYDPTKTPARGGIDFRPMPIDVDLSPQNVATAEVHLDWSFEIRGVNGPRRLQMLRAPSGWALKEIRVNGIDATDRALPFGKTDQSLSDVEVVLTDRVNEVIGTIADENGRLAPGASLVIFSTDRDRWYPKTRFAQHAAAGADGAFTIAGLPSGSYYAAAVRKLPADGEDSWQDAEFLTALLPRATTLTLGDGQKQSLTLRLERQ